MNGSLRGHAVALTCAMALMTSAWAAGDAPETSGAKKRSPLAASYLSLPLTFEANQGQTDAQVRFLARGPGYSLFLTPSESVLVLRKGKAETSDVLRLRLLGANAAPAVEGSDPLPGKSNYFRGNDRKKWHTGVPQYARVVYRDVYPGVSLTYYGSQRQLEYDFVLAPGADPRAIRFAVEGATSIRLDDAGNLVLATRGGEVVERAPVVYQEIDGKRKELAGRFVMRGAAEVGFEVAAYDATRPLVVDPQLVFSTYLGGSGQDEGFGIATDGAGNVFVAGQTSSTDFPTQSPFQANHASDGGTNDVFVASLNAATSSLNYSTYIGGNGADQGLDLALDGAGNAYVTGATCSTDFPTQGPLPGGSGINDGTNCDAFILSLDPTGGALNYSTYLGGSNVDSGNGIAVDGSGNAYVAGRTCSSDFPPVNALPGGSGINDGTGCDAFIASIDPTGSALNYSTYLGGSGGEQGLGIAVDSSGRAFVTGETCSTDFPLVNALPGGSGINDGSGPCDAFVASLSFASPTLTLNYSTYLGGSGFDEGLGVAVDASGTSAYVTGQTCSANFPIARPSGISGPCDAFVSKLTTPGPTLAYSRTLGGSPNSSGKGVAVDAFGGAYVTGFTNVATFPLVHPLPGGSGINDGTGADAFFARLNAAGTALVESTYLGGSGFEEGRRIALGGMGIAFVVGETCSANFPTANPLASPSTGINDGTNCDAFIAQLNSVQADLSITKADSADPVLSGGALSYTITVDNNGPDPATNVVVTDVVPSGLSFVSGSPGCTLNTGIVTCALGGLAVTGSTAVTLNYTVTALSGIITNTATVASDEVDPDSSNDSATQLTTVATSAGQLHFSLAAYTVVESAPNVTITVQRSFGSVGQVMVTYMTTNGSALAGSDYTGRTGVLTFNAGVTTRTFTVPILNDCFQEGPESFTVSLSAPTNGAVLSSPSTATVNITDNDVGGQVQFGSGGAFSRAENGGTATITVTRTGGAACGVTVDYIAPDPNAIGTATPGVDYTPRSGTLTFTAGLTSRTFTISIINDSLVEGSETVGLALSPPTGGATPGIPSTGTLTIVDDDSPGTLAFSAAIYSHIEAAANATITVVRTGGVSAGVTVQYATSDGTATAGLDYTGRTGVLSFGAGVTSRTFNVPILADTLSEGDETVILTLSIATGGAAIGSPNPATLNIIDDDAITVNSANDVDDGTCDAFHCSLREAINRSNGLVMVVPIRFAILTGPNPQTIQPGSSGGGDLPTITHPVIIDATTQPGYAGSPVIELNGALDTAGIGFRVAPLGAGTTIRGFAINGFGTGGTGILLNSGGNLVEKNFIGTNVGGSAASGNDRGVTVQVVSGGNTIGGTLPGNRNVISGNNVGVELLSSNNLVQGNFVGTDATGNSPVPNGIGVRVAGAGPNTIGGGGVGQGNVIAFNTGIGVSIFGSTRNSILGNSIFGNGGLGIDLAEDGVTPNDPGDGDVGSNNRQNFPFITVAIGNPPNTAVLASIFSAASTTYRIEFFASGGCDPSGHGQGQTFLGFTNITTMLNGQLQFAAVFPIATPLGQAVTATATDPAGNTSEFSACVNVTPPPTMSINDASKIETNGFMDFTVSLSGPSGQTITANYATADDPPPTGATAGSDYFAKFGVVTFPPGTTTRTISVPVVGDAVIEPDETFSLNLSNLANATPLDLTGSGTILDNDVAGTLQFSSATYNVGEASPFATITVTRTGGAASGVTVDYAVPDPGNPGTATSGADYTPVSGTLTFGANVMSRTFTVPIINDTIPEGAETIGLVLSNPSPGSATLGAQSTATLTIAASDPP